MVHFVQMSERISITGRYPILQVTDSLTAVAVISAWHRKRHQGLPLANRCELFFLFNSPLSSPVAESQRRRYGEGRTRGLLPPQLRTPPYMHYASAVDDLCLCGRGVLVE